MAEKLDDNVYALQSEGISAGSWPGYILNNNADSGNNYAYKNIVLTSMVGGDKYDQASILRDLYTCIQWAEAPGGRVDEVSGRNARLYNNVSYTYYSPKAGEYKKTEEQDGLYLVPITEKDGVHTAALYDVHDAWGRAENYYYNGLYIAAMNSAYFYNGPQNRVAWTGSISRTNNAWGLQIGTTGATMAENIGSDGDSVLAPAFNIDASKVDIRIKNGKTYIAPNALVVGGEYEIDGYNWICAEKLDDNVYAMQSDGIVACNWPGYLKGNSYYTENISFSNIASCDAKTTSFYNKWLAEDASGGSIEANGGRIYNVDENSADSGKYISNQNKGVSDRVPKNGLYLLSQLKARESPLYYCAIKHAAIKHNSSYGYAWLGTVSDTISAHVISSRATTWGSVVNRQQNSACNLAPAFNLDATKIDVTNGVITKKAS